jgi:hypothetical protein
VKIDHCEWKGRSPMKIDHVGRSPLKIDQDEHVWVGHP